MADREPAVGISSRLQRKYALRTQACPQKRKESAHILLRGSSRRCPLILIILVLTCLCTAHPTHSPEPAQATAHGSLHRTGVKLGTASGASGEPRRGECDYRRGYRRLLRTRPLDCAANCGTPALRSSERPTRDACESPARLTTGTLMSRASHAVVVPLSGNGSMNVATECD